MADEEPPNFWRLRETQSLLDWLHISGNRTIGADILRHWLDGQPTGVWWDLLREAVEQYALEIGDTELPYRHFTEWLAEWGREIRRKQTGLLLLTAHRAKGLEFDHVAVLDGGWGKRNRDEDPDAPRRLYYVALTRAKQNVVLARFNAPQPLLDALPDGPQLIRREPVPLPPPPTTLRHRYKRPTLKEIDIGFAGRYPASHPIHRAIRSLVTGDPLICRQDGERWLLLDHHDTIVGRLARSFTPPAGMICTAARVAALVTRRKEEDEYRDSIRCDDWEVIAPDLIFAPKD